MNNITLSLSIDEVNLVLEGLGNLPFVQVHELIADIHQQAKTQLDEEAKPAAPAYLETDSIDSEDHLL